VENPKNIATYYQITNCTILPSEREYFSLVILESFASGTIFLGTSVGFIPEFLSDVDQDLIITSTTPHELVKRIRWVSSLSQQKREAIIRRGMEKARGFTWQNAAWAILRELRAIQQQ
jgi:glycosyltransferase involved in cell wall biosynthesis